MLARIDNSCRVLYFALRDKEILGELLEIGLWKEGQFWFE